MMGRPEALLLTPVLPALEGSGRNLRAWAWLAKMNETYDTHVVVFGEADAKTPRDFPGASISVVPIRPVRETIWQRRLAKFLPFLVCRRGFGTDWLQLAPRPDHLAQALDGRRPERIVVFRLSLHDIAHAVRARFPQARAELDLDDFESRTRRSLARTHWRLGRWREALHEALLSVQYGIAERVLLPRYDQIFVAAPEDGVALARASVAKVSVFANRLPAPPPLPALAPTRLLFVGALDYPPNALAARWLAEMVPLLRARLPHLTPTIVGRRADKALRQRLAQCPGLEFHEDAADLLPFYGSALAVLVLAQNGGGTKFKTIEAFAHGRPVISTREGVRGLGAEAGRHYLAAETNAAVVDAVARLAADPLLARRLSGAGQQLWRERFSL